MPVIGLPAALSAFLCWPSKTRRTKKRMVLAGVLTVALTFVFLALVIGMFSAPNNVAQAIMGIPFFWLAGSIFTLGVPYIIAAIASLFFVDEK